MTTRRPLPLDRVGGLFDPGRGLTPGEIEERRRRHGFNDIAEVPARAFLDLVRDTAGDPMIWFLALTGVLYAFLGQVAEAVTLLLAMIPLIGMDAFLHRRTRASLEGLRSRIADRATVLREGRETEVPAREIVPGDLVIVGEGGWFPADGVVLAGQALQCDQSALTGESFPAAKRPLKEPPEDGAEPTVDGEHWVFAGTRLLTGRAAVRVVFTGGETIYGEIVQSAVSGPRALTPLQHALARLLRWLVGGAVIFCLLVGVVRLHQGYGWLDALVSAVTLATAALPEEFPVVFTFFLGVGIYRLARSKALVRRAVTVENIGRVTCICSDKTGTITEGRLQLSRLEPETGLDEGGLLAIATMASRAGHGDPLDAAILAARAVRGAGAPGVGAPGVQASTAAAPERIATFPFTEDRKRETAIFRRADGSLLAATKGAPEHVLSATTLPPPEAAAWSARVTALSESGCKVIACATRDATGAGEPTGGFRMAGLLAFEDPVRDGVREAIGRCRAAGIRTVMVTGDHPATALSVARAVGLGDGAPDVVSGEDLATRLQAGRRGAPPDVVARATPGQKLALVRALQEAGEIVAVTGDGVNDVPALQAADIGIAMGERGTRSARESAAIVLMDDNFATIVRAVAEGRQLFANLRLSFEYLLMIHIPLVLSAALIPLAGYPLLYLPIHIVWLEMIIHPTALLVFQDLPPAGPMGAPRRGRAERFFSSAEMARIGAVGLLLALLVILAFVRGLGEAGELHGRSLALAVLIGSGTMLMAWRSRLKTRTARLVASLGLLGSAVLIQVPWAATHLHLEPLHPLDWATVTACALLVLATAIAGAALTSRAAGRGTGRAAVRASGRAAGPASRQA
jgi:Ca2+-transporting ATPase